MLFGQHRLSPIDLDKRCQPTARNFKEISILLSLIRLQ
jgi:hypothetical protein